MVASATSPGHAFPGLALGRALRARGHDVLVETSEQWRSPAEDLGLRFVAAEDLGDVPREPGWSDWALHGARSLLPVMRDYRPDVVVADVVMPAAPLAAEVLGVRWATLMPVVYTLNPPGLPVYPLGFLPPRTPLGAAMWRTIGPPLRTLVPHPRWLRTMPRLINAVRGELGLGSLRDFHGGITSYGTISDRLAMVATFPQLEYPKLGCRLKNPFSQLEFSFACGEIGDLRLSDEGLLRVDPPEMVELVVA